MRRDPAVVPPLLPAVLLADIDRTSPRWIKTFTASLIGVEETQHIRHKARVNRYLLFCSVYNVSPPFPKSESVLCYFLVSLGKQGLTPGTIRTYLAAVWHEVLVRGFPEVHQKELPRIQFVTAGIRHERALQWVPQTLRLPITPEILGCLTEVWVDVPDRYDYIMLWAAASLCFFGFFRSGEITVQSVGSIPEFTWHGGGGKVFVGATGNVWATVTYLARRGDSPSPFSRTDSRIPYQGQVR